LLISPFEIDVLARPRCGGHLRLIATVEDPEAIRAVLAILAERADRHRQPSHPSTPATLLP
jgi:hypothetical protein